jgi:hypothetical protein
MGASRVMTRVTGNGSVRERARLAANASHRIAPLAADSDEPARITRKKE